MRFVQLLYGLSLAVMVLCPAAAVMAAKKNNAEWLAFKEQQICYVASLPMTEAGKYSSRGTTYIQVSQFPNRKEYDVFTVRAGYTYKKDSSVTLTIDGERYSLFTHKNRAWAHNTKTDRAIATAMRAGLKMIVVGISSRGTKTTDTYTLKGFTRAYEASRKKCRL